MIYQRLEGILKQQKVMAASIHLRKYSSQRKSFSSYLINNLRKKIQRPQNVPVGAGAEATELVGRI
jgi:hypothetical protein